MKAYYPPFGGQITQQHFKCYNSQVISAKFDCIAFLILI